MVEKASIYRHFKGDIYQVICVGAHTETGEKMVAYRDNKNNFWIRPLEMFQEEVEVNGKIIRRFTKLNDT